MTNLTIFKNNKHHFQFLKNNNFSKNNYNFFVPLLDFEDQPEEFAIRQNLIANSFSKKYKNILITDPFSCDFYDILFYLIFSEKEEDPLRLFLLNDSVVNENSSLFRYLFINFKKRIQIIDNNLLLENINNFNFDLIQLSNNFEKYSDLIKNFKDRKIKYFFNFPNKALNEPVVNESFNNFCKDNFLIEGGFSYLYRVNFMLKKIFCVPYVSNILEDFPFKEIEGNKVVQLIFEEGDFFYINDDKTNKSNYKIINNNVVKIIFKDKIYLLIFLDEELKQFFIVPFFDI